MQNIVIVWRTSSVYLAGAGAGTGASEELALLGARISCSESPSPSESLYLTEHGGSLQGGVWKRSN